MRKGERRAGVGTGAVDGSLGEERNESVTSKDRMERNLPNCHRSPNSNIWEAPCRAMVIPTEVNSRTLCGWNNCQVSYAIRDYHLT